ncbi:M1 family metallopeptidase [Candidatus Neomarinimicrobiota bacterium]
MRLVLLITVLTVGIVAASDMQMKDEAISFDFDVTSYNLIYEIDASEKQFNSIQKIGIVNVSEEKVNKFYFLLQPDLLIDNISVLDAKGRSLRVSSWELLETKQIYNNTLQIVQVQTAKRIAPGREYQFRLVYHMRPEAIQDSVVQGDQILDLTIGAESSYAIGPTSGHNALFNRNIAAPFSMTVKYPEGNYCCAPGDLVSSEQRAGQMIETYQSKTPKIPAFSCAPYEKHVRSMDGNTYEFYLYPGQPFVEDMASIVSKIVQLYTTSFGDPGTDTYRLANVGVEGSSFPPGLENKGNAIYLTDLLTRYYALDDFAKEMFIGMVAHELFHNWNLFTVNWTGKLMNWFEEGGANFVAGWAVEQLFGEDIAAAGRVHFAESYDGGQGFRGYDAEGTLESVYKNDMPSLMLMYYYGALVWEQLRQKVGDEAMFAGMGDFFGKYAFKSATYQDFLQCLQTKTDIQVEEYLDQWIKHNARIDLSIGTVDIVRVDERYQTEVEIVVEADRDYELITTLGYSQTPDGQLELIEVHPIRQGVHKVVFESDNRPTLIQIDPACRVPQINLANNSWSE